MIKKILCILVASSIIVQVASCAREIIHESVGSVLYQDANERICKRVAQACINVHQSRIFCDDHANTFIVTATPLHYKIANNRMQQAQCLIQLGADLNMFDYGGLTPIHLAVYLGPRNIHEVASFLCATQKIRNDLSIMDDIKDSCGRSAIEFLWQLKSRAEHALQKLNKELLPITYHNQHNYVCAINNFAIILQAQLQPLHFKQKVTYDKASDLFDRRCDQQLTCSK